MMSGLILGQIILLIFALCVSQEKFRSLDLRIHETGCQDVDIKDVEILGSS